MYMIIVNVQRAPRDIRFSRIAGVYRFKVKFVGNELGKKIYIYLIYEEKNRDL